MNRIHRHLSTVTALTSLERYGKQSSSTYGKIDDLTCSYDGNHLTAISDNAPIPTISGSFDFKDEASTTAEYLYDENGLRPDVTKGNNNRVVVAENDSIVQINHYYPYGGVIGDISTLLSDVTKGNNENVQKYKLFHYIPREQARSEGKELDRTFGLDNYDIYARQYFAMMPSWDRIDKYAEKYYSISPYSYCGGDPVNRGDYNGKYISLGDNPSWSLISGYAIARAELSRVGADKNLRALEMDMTCVVKIVEIRPDDCDGNQFDYKSNTMSCPEKT